MAHQAVKVLVANRGEIAIRLQASILAEGHIPVGLYSADEGPNAAHLRGLEPSSRLLLPGSGVTAYLNVNAIISVALQNGIAAIQPGYGFLSESPTFAEAVQQAGMIWIGPRPDTLRLFGDKHASKEFARSCGVPVLPSTSATASTQEIKVFAHDLAKSGFEKIILKALHGGGGRGIRVVNDLSTLDEQLQSCKREAKLAFGRDEVFAEPFLAEARHIEIQVIGDGQGEVRDVGDRECSIQRRYQKIIELCPSPTLLQFPTLCTSITAAAVTLAARAKVLSLITVEFLFVPPDKRHPDGLFYFLEVNPRIQVEHTVTEAAYSVDLVALQLSLAFDVPIEALSWPDRPSRHALQLRLNAEKFQPDGSTFGTVGKVTSFCAPTGPFVRIDTALHGPLPPPIGLYCQTLNFDSLLAKIIVVADDYAGTISTALRALAQLHVGGLETNKSLLMALLNDRCIAGNDGVHTKYIEHNAATIFKQMQEFDRSWHAQTEEATGALSTESLDAHSTLSPPPEGQRYLISPLPGKLVEVAIAEGQVISQGEVLATVESMKMEHNILADHSGRIRAVLKRSGEEVKAGDAIVLLIQGLDDPNSALGSSTGPSDREQIDLEIKPSDLIALEEIRSQRNDDHPLRRSAVKKRHQRGFRTAQETLNQLVDGGRLDVEYGDLALAAQRSRLDEEALLRTRGDAVLTGFARVNSRYLPGTDQMRRKRARCSVILYDYIVLAGTQGHFHHLKLDRMFHNILSDPAPVILFAEGGGGRPADVDVMNVKVAGLDTPSFPLFAEIHAAGIPIVAVANGYTFAGNAALLGTADIVIATQQSSTGFGGPAMIEGGGLGRFAPDNVGPPASHLVNGNFDIIVENEHEATEMVKRVVSFWQGSFDYQPNQQFNKDQRRLRHIIPSSKKAYDVRRILHILADEDFIEIGATWGKSLVCGFLRVEGRPLAIVASNVSSELGGAIDVASAKKATRFIKMLTKTRCAHLAALCDTPGFLVGPEAEKHPLGTLRAFPEYFAACAAFRMSGGGRIFGLTLKRGVGLGAEVILGGSTLTNLHSAAWPGATFSAMGMQGAVRLGFAKQLAACKTSEERQELERCLIQELEVRGQATRMAEFGEIDTVIDPAETRDWLKRCLDIAEERVAITEQTERRHGLGGRHRL